MRASGRTYAMLADALACQEQCIVIVGTTDAHAVSLLMCVEEMCQGSKDLVSFERQNNRTLIINGRTYKFQGRDAALVAHRNVFIDHKAWEDSLCDLMARFRHQPIPVDQIDPNILPDRGEPSDPFA